MQTGGSDARPPLGENRRDSRGHRRRRAGPAHGSEADLSLVTAPWLGGRNRDAGRREIGLDSTAEREPSRGERGDRSSALALGNFDVSDRHCHRNAGSDQGANLANEPVCEPHHGNPGGNVEAECSGRQRPVDEDREGARRCRLLHRLVRQHAPREQHGTARDAADPVGGEEP